MDFIQENDSFGYTKRVTKECVFRSERPILVVKSKEGFLIHLYKSQSGNCWYEYETKSDDPENSKRKIKRLNPENQKKFMRKYIDMIVEPNENVAQYLKYRSYI